MGRKIKGKKHHGVKDPEKQKKNREAKFKMKVNTYLFIHRNLYGYFCRSITDQTKRIFRQSQKA